MSTLPIEPRSLVVFAPSYAIACDCLRVDHRINPRHPALLFIRRPYELAMLPKPVPVLVIDPFAKRSLEDDSRLYHLRKAGFIRDWTDAEMAAVAL